MMADSDFTSRIYRAVNVAPTSNLNATNWLEKLSIVIGILSLIIGFLVYSISIAELGRCLFFGYYIDDTPRSYQITYIVKCVLWMMVSTSEIIVSYRLLYGIIKKKPRFVLDWVLWNGFIIGTSYIVSFLGLLKDNGIEVIFPINLLLVPVVLIIFVMYKCYCRIKEKLLFEKNQANGVTQSPACI